MILVSNFSSDRRLGLRTAKPTAPMPKIIAADVIDWELPRIVVKPPKCRDARSHTYPMFRVRS